MGNRRDALSADDLAQKIDHTLLRPDAVDDEYEQLFSEAQASNFHSVCVPPDRVKMAKVVLGSSPVKVCTVVGFPSGFNTSDTKIQETQQAFDSGCDEFDVMMNLGAFKSHLIEYVSNELRMIIAAAQQKTVKIIIETSLLNPEQIRKACQICEAAGADFVKTSTGFLGDGASIEQIKIMRETLSPNVKIKASGGIRTLDHALEFLNNGVDRLGTSAGVDMLGELRG